MHKFKIGDKVRVIERAYRGDLEVGYKGIITQYNTLGGVLLDDTTLGWFYGIAGGELGLVESKYNGEGLPPIGFRFNFQHEFIKGYYYLTYGGKYGWEDGDNLEVIHTTTNSEGEEVAIVLNTEPDVLTTAPITDMRLFLPVKTKEELALEEIELLINEELSRENDEFTHERNSCKELAKTLYNNGYRKVEATT